MFSGMFILCYTCSSITSMGYTTFHSIGSVSWKSSSESSFHFVFRYHLYHFTCLSGCTTTVLKSIDLLNVFKRLYKVKNRYWLWNKTALLFYFSSYKRSRFLLHNKTENKDNAESFPIDIKWTVHSGSGRLSRCYNVVCVCVLLRKHIKHMFQIKHPRTISPTAQSPPPTLHTLFFRMRINLNGPFVQYSNWEYCFTLFPNKRVNTQFFALFKKSLYLEWVHSFDK